MFEFHRYVLNPTVEVVARPARPMTTALPPFFIATVKKQGFFGSATNLPLAALPKWINKNGSAAKKVAWRAAVGSQGDRGNNRRRKS
jgi:hypothetical protein